WNDAAPTDGRHHRDHEIAGSRLVAHQLIVLLQRNAVLPARREVAVLDVVDAHHQLAGWGELGVPQVAAERTALDGPLFVRGELLYRRPTPPLRQLRQPLRRGLLRLLVLPLPARPGLRRVPGRATGLQDALEERGARLVVPALRARDRRLRGHETALHGRLQDRR